MKIGEVARRAGATVKAVRYYEELGLVAPARLANGYRDYSEQDARLVSEARALTALGISAQATRPFLECLAGGREHADDCPSSLAAYRDAIDDLTGRIEALTARRDALAGHLHAAARRNSPTAEAARPPSTGGPSCATPARAPAPAPGPLPRNLPVPQDDGAADHLAGCRLPALALPSTAGGTVALRGLGPGRTVLYCYPLTGRPDADMPDGWDGIPGARGCTAQACDFRDHHQELAALGATRVFGVSGQHTDYQREVSDRLRLPFAMLSDPALRLASSLGLPTFEAGGAVLHSRITLIVRDDVIEHVFYPVFPPDKHAGQVLEWLGSNPT